MFLTTAALCLALNIYHESRGESLTGQHAVAQVTMNRAGRDPKNVCEVVTKPKQFSWTMSLTKKTKTGVALKKDGLPKDEKAWSMARQIASLTLKGQVQDFTRGATFYHAKRVRPQWSKAMTLVATYGAHRFYRYA